MKSSNRSQLRLFALVALVVIALVFWHRARAQGIRPSPPHVTRIVGVTAYARLPDASLIELPPGTTFGAARLSYDHSARITDITGTAELFRDGFAAGE